MPEDTGGGIVRLTSARFDIACANLAGVLPG